MSLIDDRKLRYKSALAHCWRQAQDVAKSLQMDKGHLPVIISRGAPRDRFDEVAIALKVDPEWLMSGQGAPPSWAISAPTTWPHTWAVPDDTGDFRMPLIGSAAAATGHQVNGDEEGGTIPIKAKWQAIKIRGSSGEPVVLNEQTVMVDPTLKATKNRLVVAFTDDGPVLKRYVKEIDGKLFLASINAGVDSLVVDAQSTRIPLVVVGVLFTDSVAK